MSKMWSTCNGTLFRHKREWNSDICCNMNETWRYHAKCNVRHKRTNMIPLIWDAKNSNIHGDRKWNGEGGGNGNILFNGYRVSVWNDNILKMLIIVIHKMWMKENRTFFMSSLTFYWSIVDLHHCVSFSFIAKWFTFGIFLLQIIFHYRYYKVLSVVTCAI